MRVGKLSCRVAGRDTMGVVCLGIVNQSKEKASQKGRAVPVRAADRSGGVESGKGPTSRPQVRIGLHSLAVLVGGSRLSYSADQDLRFGLT